MHVLAHEHHHLDRLGHVVRPRAPTARVGVEQAGRVVAVPAIAHAIALHHQLGRSLDDDRAPDVIAVDVHRDGDRVDRGARRLQFLQRRLHLAVRDRLALRPAETLLDDGDPEALGGLAEGGHVVLGLRADLTRIEAVRAGDGRQQARHVLDRGAHRAAVVDRQLDGEDARIGHEAVRLLEAVDAAPARRHADRAALIAAERHRHLAGDVRRDEWPVPAR